MDYQKYKKALLFSTSGTPNEIYSEIGMHNSMKQTVDQGIFNFSGLEEVNHTFFCAVPHVTDEIREGYLKEVSKIINDIL